MRLWLSISVVFKLTSKMFWFFLKRLHLLQLVLTTCENIFNELINVIEVNEVEWIKSDSVRTVGAPYMVDRIKGFVTLIENLES